ncbi:Histidine--tRNA ligase, chloroplastic/mitochondrial [Linum grandiflorum]
MPPITSSIHVVTPRIFLRLKPFLTSLPQLSPSAISPRKFVAPTINRRARFCTAAARDNGGRSGAISGPPVMEGEEAATKIDVNPPKGTRDFPPEEMRLRNWLFHNFKESEALFIRKAGEEIRDQKSAPLPLKWFAVGQCWRYERMTRGRRREHYQWNMDIIGVPEVTAEAELISSIVTFFKRIGITASDVGFKVSSRKELLRRYSISEKEFGKVCVIIDKIEKMPIEEIKKDLSSVGLSEDVIKELLQVLTVKSLTELEGRLTFSLRFFMNSNYTTCVEILGGSGEAVSDLKQLFSLAEKFGYAEWIQFDASVVRGLAYYTGIGFDRDGKLRAICGGGRYDRLLSTFGGDDLPACGFGFGDAVIVELLKEKNLFPELSLQVDNIVCALDKNLQAEAAAIATNLRQKGQSTDLVLENKSLKWVFKRAARANAERLILVGTKEWEKGMVSVKILASNEQYEVKVEELD